MPPHQVDEDEHDVQVDHESRGDVLLGVQAIAQSAHH